MEISAAHARADRAIRASVLNEWPRLLDNKQPNRLALGASRQAHLIPQRIHEGRSLTLPGGAGQGRAEGSRVHPSGAGRIPRPRTPGVITRSTVALTSSVSILTLTPNRSESIWRVIAFTSSRLGGDDASGGKALTSNCSSKRRTRPALHRPSFRMAQLHTRELTMLLMSALPRSPGRSTWLAYHITRVHTPS
jgi:hypothetical protein